MFDLQEPHLILCSPRELWGVLSCLLFLMFETVRHRGSMRWISQGPRWGKGVGDCHNYLQCYRAICRGQQTYPERGLRWKKYRFVLSSEEMRKGVEAFSQAQDSGRTKKAESKEKRTDMQDSQDEGITLATERF